MRRSGALAVLVAGFCAVGLIVPGVAASAASRSKSGSYLIGVSEPMTGADAPSGTEIYDGELLAVAKINAAGGVLGKKIVLKEEDDACQPQTAVDAANKLVSLGVKAMVGGYCSAAAEPAEPIYSRADIPNIQAAANATTLVTHGYHNIFLVDPTGGLQAHEAASFFTKVLKLKNVFIADDESTYAVNVAKLTTKDLAGTSTKTFPLEAVPATDEDFAPVISTLRADNAAAIYWTGYFAQAAEFVRQIRTAGLTIPFITADGSVTPTYIKDAGVDANGTYSTIAVLSSFLAGPAAKSFDKRYESKFHATPGPYSAYGYDGMYALADAAKAAKSLAPSKVITALHRLKFSGLTGEVSFASNGARIGAHFVVLEVVAGQYKLAPHQPPA